MIWSNWLSGYVFGFYYFTLIGIKDTEVIERVQRRCMFRSQCKFISLKRIYASSQFLPYSMPKLLTVSKIDVYSISHVWPSGQSQPWAASSWWIVFCWILNISISLRSPPIRCFFPLATSEWKTYVITLLSRNNDTWLSCSFRPGLSSRFLYVVSVWIAFPPLQIFEKCMFGHHLAFTIRSSFKYPLVFSLAQYSPSFGPSVVSVASGSTLFHLLCVPNFHSHLINLIILAISIIFFVPFPAETRGYLL